MSPTVSNFKSDPAVRFRIIYWRFFSFKSPDVHITFSQSDMLLNNILRFLQAFRLLFSGLTSFPKIDRLQFRTVVENVHVSNRKICSTLTWKNLKLSQQKLRIFVDKFPYLINIMRNQFEILHAVKRVENFD